MVGLHIAIILLYARGTAANMPNQLDSEGLRNLMMMAPSMLMRVMKLKDLMMTLGSNACAIRIMTLLEGPLFAAFACLATPRGEGKPTGVVGTLRRTLVGTTTAARAILAVNVGSRVGRMWGWGPPPRCDFSVLQPRNCLLLVGRAARTVWGNSVAVGLPAMLPERALMGVLQRLRGRGLHLQRDLWTRSSRRQPGSRPRPGCTFRTRAWWATASGLVPQIGMGKHLLRHRIGSSMLQFVGNSTCLGALAESNQERLPIQWRAERLQRRDVAGRHLAAVPTGTRTRT